MQEKKGQVNCVSCFFRELHECVYVIWTCWVLPTEAPSAVGVADDSDGEVG